MNSADLPTAAPLVRTRDGLLRLKVRPSRSLWAEEAIWFAVCATAGMAALVVVWLVARLG